MKEQLTERLQQLKNEYDTGQKMLADAELKRAELQNTLLRISGAIQVLEEMLAEDGKDKKVIKQINFLQ